MAKKSKVVKNIQREKMVDRYYDRRLKLKAIVKDPNSTYAEKRLAYQKLEKMPRDANPIRLRNRCNLTGRPRGVYRRFGLSRISLREMVNNGLIPGVRKASW
ncbi:MAG: 30S ribosomal protein S14 [Candidatus Marinimicrobia bacterium]|nr:30S ribosomal protein S14 [Candidatus Neomarinimicrobiota bacterium]|tara:strand:+ start:21789 stop:22094 length:306 start_codon:yes stop_codon:yes gene_type:complete